VLGLTPEDLHDLLPFPWLRRVERLLLNLRKIALAFGDEHQLLDDEESQRLDIAGEIVMRCAVASDGRHFGGSSAPESRTQSPQRDSGFDIEQQEQSDAPDATIRSSPSHNGGAGTARVSLCLKEVLWPLMGREWLTGRGSGPERPDSSERSLRVGTFNPLQTPMDTRLRPSPARPPTLVSGLRWPDVFS
jgi:hypothetical protein